MEDDDKRIENRSETCHANRSPVPDFVTVHFRASPKSLLQLQMMLEYLDDQDLGISEQVRRMTMMI
jgi:hypothetical protein